MSESSMSGDPATFTLLPLRLTSAQRDRIAAEGVAAYPNECCGILYGVER